QQLINVRWRVSRKQIEQFAFMVAQRDGFKHRLNVRLRDAAFRSIHAENALSHIARKLFHDIAPMLYEFRAVFDQEVCPERGLRSDVAWHCENLTALFVSQPGGDQAPAVLRRFDYQNAETESAQDAVAIGEILRQRWRAQREFRNYRAARRNFFLQLLVLFRIGHFQAGAD